MLPHSSQQRMRVRHHKINGHHHREGSDGDDRETEHNEVYKQFFDEHQATYPTRSCVQVARLPKDVKLEIEAIAVRSA